MHYHKTQREREKIGTINVNGGIILFHAPIPPQLPLHITFPSNTNTISLSLKEILPLQRAIIRLLCCHVATGEELFTLGETPVHTNIIAAQVKYKKILWEQT